MKGSLITSAVLHSAALALALVSIGAPSQLDMADVEALPVDIVPVSELTEIQQGDRNAPLAERSAPVPTARPDPVENAENIGDSDIDLKTPPTPQARPREVEVAAAPERVETPAPVNDTVTNDAREIVKEDTAPPLPATRPEARPEPPAPEPVPQEQARAEPPPPAPQPEPPAPQPEPQPQEAQQPTAETGEIAIPQEIPVPTARPRPPERPAETRTAAAKPAESRPAEQPSAPRNAREDTRRQESARSASSKQSDFSADEVAALLNKTEAAGGGAKRSTEQAALGGQRTTGGSTLSQSELDALRGQIQNNWSIIPGMADASDVRIQVRMRLDESGAIVGEPQVTASGGSEAARRALAGGARRAVMKSSPFRNLPPEKYDAWSEVIVNFDPSELI